MKKILSLVMLFSIGAPVVAQTVTQFQAVLTPEAVITGGVMPSAGVSDALGIANFTLSQPLSGPTTLSYSMEITGIDLDGAQTPGFPNDDLTALHFHDTTQCSMATPSCIMGTDTVGTMHVLNVAGFPRTDDADVMVNAVAGMVSGIWDDGDENLMFPPSNALTGFTENGDAILKLLFDEKLFVNVHTNTFGLGEIGGFIRQVPEPASFAAMLLGLAVLVIRRHK